MGSRLRIAFVDDDLSPRTGSRRFTYEVARKLGDFGHEVRIFTSRLDPQKCFGQYLSLPVEVISNGSSLGGESAHAVKLAVQQSKRSSMLNLAKYYAYCLRQTDFALKTSEKMADVGCNAAMLHYHGEHWLMPIFYYLNGPKGGVYLNMVPPRPRPLALPFQESTLERRIVDKLFNLPPIRGWENASFNNVALFITPSEFQLQQAKLQGVIGQKRAAVVPLGVDHTEFQPTGEEEPFALYLGRIHPHKSLELAIMAMEHTRPDHSLIIAGDIDEQNMWYKDKLLDLAEKLKISDRVQLILRPSDFEGVRLMQRCSVFLFPSTIDSFGLVVLEAMACGKPVVACNKGGVPEIVQDAGFLLDPDVRQWSETVEKLFSDSELRRRLGQKALERSKNFSWGHTANRLIHVFENPSGKCLD